MDFYQVGFILKEFRLRYGISQEELCFGLCASSTLSRIENGRVLPTRGLCETLFRRMGVQPPMEQIPMDCQEFSRYQLEVHIIGEYVRGNLNFSQLLASYRELDGTKDVFGQQFHSFFQLMHHKHCNRVHPCIIHDHLLHTLRLTLKDFAVGCDLSCRYLSRMELLILVGIATNLRDLGQKKAALSLMEFLKTYYETKVPDQQLKSRNYIAVLLHLSKWRLEDGRHREALALATMGIRVCMDYSTLYLLPQLFYTKGFCLAQLGKEGSGLEHIRNAISLLKYMGKQEQAADLMENTRNKLPKIFASLQPLLSSGFSLLTDQELLDIDGGRSMACPLAEPFAHLPLVAIC